MADSNQPIVLNGVGTAYIKKSGRSYKLGTLQDMQIDFSGSLEKWYGGDSLVPIYYIDKDQEVKVSFTEAQFNLDWFAFAKGATMDNAGVLIGETDPTLIASGTAYTVPGSLTTIVPTSCVCMIADDANMKGGLTILTYNGGTPGAGEFKITAAGVVTLGASVTNKYIVVSYLYTDAVSRTATLTTASFPSIVEIRHKSYPIPMANGTTHTIHTVIYAAKSDGKFTIDHKRNTASASKLMFEVQYDSTRTDNKILSMTQVVS